MHSILVVDDDNYQRGLYEEVFKEVGFNVISGKDGQEGLELAQKNKPDIILTGINMPRLSGFEMILKLKQDPATNSIPFVISSHLGSDNDREQAQKLGAKAFVIKGRISPRQMIGIVNDILNNKVEVESFKVAIDPGKYDAQKLRTRLGLQGELILELTPGYGRVDRDFLAKVTVDGKHIGQAKSEMPADEDEYSKVLRDLEAKLGKHQ